MADREPPYDPYIPAGGAAPGGSAAAAPSGNQRTAALQAVSIASAPTVSRMTCKDAFLLNNDLACYTNMRFIVLYRVCHTN